MDIIKVIAKEFSMDQRLVRNIAGLSEEGNTIPFIARYRKELTGSCDDQKLRELAERLEYLEKRKSEVLAAIAQQEKLTPPLEEAIQAAGTLARLEDIYRPYKQKRRTRATVAREKGLEPLARLIFAQELTKGNVLELAAGYISQEKGVATAEEALAGARDIIAEELSDDADLRQALRELFWQTGRIRHGSGESGAGGGSRRRSGFSFRPGQRLCQKAKGRPG